MLVLSRKAGEKVLVPELDLVITVVGVSPHRVRIGIEAPDKVHVVREELIEVVPGHAACEPPAQSPVPPPLREAVRRRIQADCALHI